MASSPVPPLATTTVQVEERFVFTVTTLCRAAGTHAEQLRELVSEGVLQPIAGLADEWQFSGQALPRTRTALRLARDFELDFSAVALVMDLLDEIENLRNQLRHDPSAPPARRRQTDEFQS